MIGLGSLYIGAAYARLGYKRSYLGETIADLREEVLIRPNSSIAFLLPGAAYFKAQSCETTE